MPRRSASPRKFAASLRSLSDPELYLRQTVRLTLRETAGALASIRIAALSDDDRNYRTNLISALRQLESFSESLELLVTEPDQPVRLDRALERLCKSIGFWKACHGPGTLQLALDPLVVDGATARRMSLIVSELLGNAYRYGLEVGGETIWVALTGGPNTVNLSVQDDGPGTLADPPAHGAKLGLCLTAELAERAGGVLRYYADDTGTTVQLTLPMIAPVSGPRR